MAHLEFLRNEPDVRSFRQGEPIFKVGDAADCMFAVIEGEVEIRRDTHVLERVTPGGVFGEMALIDGAPRSATALAATDCRVAAVGQQRFLRIIVQVPQFALQMMRVLTERLRRVQD